VFEELSVDGSKEILFVRACAPTADKRPDAGDGQGFELATQFVHWHPPELQASGVDPSLTRMALCAAADGLPPQLLDQPGCAQYGGLEGGLRSLVKLFAPEVHVQSLYPYFPIPIPAQRPAPQTLRTRCLAGCLGMQLRLLGRAAFGPMVSEVLPRLASAPGGYERPPEFTDVDAERAGVSPEALLPNP